MDAIPIPAPDAARGTATDRVPIALLAGARTGTNLLRSLLSEDPSLVDCSEVFNPDLDKYYPTFWTFVETERRASDAGVLPPIIEAAERAEQFARYLQHLQAFHPGRQLIIDIKYHDVAVVDTLRRLPDETPVVLSTLMSRGAPKVKRRVRAFWRGKLSTVSLTARRLMR